MAEAWPPGGRRVGRGWLGLQTLLPAASRPVGTPPFSCHTVFIDPRWPRGGPSPPGAPCPLPLGLSLLDPPPL